MRPFSNLWFSDAAVMRYVEIFFRRRWLFIIPAVLGLVLGVVLGGFMPKVYEASTVIMIDEEKIMNPLIQGLAVSTPATQRIRTLKEEILSWDRLVRLTHELRLGKNIQNQKDLEEVVATLRQTIVVQMGGPNLVRIAYQSNDPAQAQNVVKTIMSTFIEENVKAQTKEAGVAIDFLEGQLKVYRRKMHETEIAQMEDRLKGLLVDSTEEHPLVKDLRHQIAEAQANLEQTERSDPPPKPVTDPMFEKVRQMVMNSQTAGEGGSTVEAPPGLDPQIFQLYVLMSNPSISPNNFPVNSNIYNQLLSRLETARITQQLDASKEGTRYTVLDPPRMPLKPIKPNRMVVALLGVFLGAVAGTGLILLVEMADRSFHTVEDAADFLQLPVIGAINRIWTNSEVQQRQVKQRFAAFAVGGVLTAVLAGTFVLNLIR